MKKSKLERKSLRRTVVGAALIIGASTLTFHGLTQVAAGVEYNKMDQIPTNYVHDQAHDAEKAQSSLPEGYQKANYTVSTIDLDYYKDQTLTSKDMLKEEAAEIGAQALWTVFGVHLDGQVIEMGYQSANEGLPRSQWVGEVSSNSEWTYAFTVDSVTGELFDIGRSRTLNENVSVAFDLALDKNPQEYIEMAKETAENLNIVYGPVASVEYNGQGYSVNDPDISLDIKGENGEIALVTFSRYDKSLKGISYHASYKYTLEEIERNEQELQHITIPSVDDEYEAPTLIITSEE